MVSCFSPAGLSSNLERSEIYQKGWLDQVRSACPGKSSDEALFVRWVTILSFV